jgi:hypothetical protein
LKWLKNLLGCGQQESESASVATVQKESGNVYLLRIGGTFSKGAMDRVQSIAAKDIQRGADGLKILIVLADFCGWKKGDDWGNMDFFFQHEASIAKLAVVGDEQWKAETLMFLGAGRRTGEVHFFETGQEDAARTWLAEETPG